MLTDEFATVPIETAASYPSPQGACENIGPGVSLSAPAAPFFSKGKHGMK